MPARRATLHLDPRLFRALKIKSAETDVPLSELVNRALRQALAEDAADLEAFERTAREPRRPFAQVVRDLKRDGLL
jgi:hypothetical protein